jgi:Tektin family
MYVLIVYLSAVTCARVHDRVTVTKTWLKFTRENLCRCQRERERSAVVRAQTEALVRKVALEIWKCIQTVNRGFAIRIMEINDAHQKLLQHVERVCNFGGLHYPINIL